jgi:ABC-type dipeptide/oligopeptide/nickel transport system permease component
MMWMVLVLFVLSVIVFALMHSVPGGPFAREKPLPEKTLEIMNKKYHLDDPIYVQYLSYMGDIVIPTVTTGVFKPNAAEDYLINIGLPAFAGNDATFRWMNFGPTYKSRSRSVNDIFRENLPISFKLGVVAIGIAVLIGIPLGILTALNRNTLYDYLGMGVAVLGVSVPVIITAPFLQYFMGVNLKVLPVTGWGTLEHMVLPCFVLGFANSALIARLTRASLLQVLHEDYIRTAQSKGLHPGAVIGIHALKNSMIPVVTVLGPLFAALVTGTFVVETIFGIPGMGRFFVVSISGRDYPVIMGTILLYAALLTVANLLVDITYAWLDPRIRYN